MKSFVVFFLNKLLDLINRKKVYSIVEIPKPKDGASSNSLRCIFTEGRPVLLLMILDPFALIEDKFVCYRPKVSVAIFNICVS
jgi:hypothetical protein